MSSSFPLDVYGWCNGGRWTATELRTLIEWTGTMRALSQKLMRPVGSCYCIRWEIQHGIRDQNGRRRHGDRGKEHRPKAMGAG